MGRGSFTVGGCCAVEVCKNDRANHEFYNHVKII